MLTLLLLTAGILAVSILFLSVNIILRGGKFRSEHVGQSKALRAKGIHCVQSMDAQERARHSRMRL